ncbi:MAG: hypothetical protein IPP77_15350 [Bacteroidetes bacterium]|nr:hypothetical protein [Bacteroidota bacterium]
MQSILHFPDIQYLLANLVFNLFPFSYVIWNAKNMGLSARGVGLLAGQIYIYLLVAYLLNPSLWLFAALFIAVFVIFLLSQMAIQFVLLTLPFIVLFFRVPELLLLPVLALGSYFLILPRVAKNFVIGQFNHKRNYALFLGEIFILKTRYSIWRDLVYDFWKKLKEEPRKIRALNYMLTNPVVEFIYGMPFIWMSVGVFYFFTPATDLHTTSILNVLAKLLVIALLAFVLTSFRWTRFLGEPQRYLEFTFPVATLMFILIFPMKWVLIYSGFWALFISVYVFGNRKYSSDKKPGDKGSLPERVLRVLDDISIPNQTITSNDYQLMKILSASKFSPLMPCITNYYKDKAAFQIQFNNSFEIISPNWIIDHIDRYNPAVVLINTSLYAGGLLSSESDLFLANYSLQQSVESIEIYSRNA